MTTETLTLAGFLRARIDEEEAYMREVASVMGALAPDGILSPRRFLAECETKRRILDDHAPAAVAYSTWVPTDSSAEDWETRGRSFRPWTHRPVANARRRVRSGA